MNRSTFILHVYIDIKIYYSQIVWNLCVCVCVFVGGGGWLLKLKGAKSLFVLAVDRYSPSASDAPLISPMSKNKTKQKNKQSLLSKNKTKQKTNKQKTPKQKQKVNKNKIIILGLQRSEIFSTFTFQKRKLLLVIVPSMFMLSLVRVAPFHAAALLWNKLPRNIREAPTIHVFKSLFKTGLFSSLLNYLLFLNCFFF